MILSSFEARNGKIPPNSAVIFGTGWSRNLARKDYFTKNPGLSAGAAKYLSKKRVSLIGIDSPSIDLGKDSKFSAHHVSIEERSFDFGESLQY